MEGTIERERESMCICVNYRLRVREFERERVWLCVKEVSQLRKITY